MCLYFNEMLLILRCYFWFEMKANFFLNLMSKLCLTVLLASKMHSRQFRVQCPFIVKYNNLFLVMWIMYYGILFCSHSDLCKIVWNHLPSISCTGICFCSTHVYVHLYILLFVQNRNVDVLLTDAQTNQLS